MKTKLLALVILGILIFGVLMESVSARIGDDGMRARMTAKSALGTGGKFTARITRFPDGGKFTARLMRFPDGGKYAI